MLKITNKAGHALLIRSFCAFYIAVISACGGSEDTSANNKSLPNSVSTNETLNTNFAPQGLYERSDIAFAQAITGSVIPSSEISSPVAKIAGPDKTVNFLISNFNTATDKVSNWKFINGAEYPGAKGSLTEISSDLDGSAAVRLSYDLGCDAAAITIKTNETCGRYVGMVRQLIQPVEFSSGDTLSLTFKYKDLQGMVNPMIRIVDATGQNFQYKTTNRTLENKNHQDWQHTTVNLKSFITHFGGANDGVMRSPIKEVFIGVGNFTLQMPAGWIDIDDIEIIKNRSQTYELNDRTPVAVPSVYASYIGRLAAATYTSLELAHKKAKDVGITIVRRGMQWGSVEKNGTYDFTEFDRIADTLKENGMSVLWLLNGGHSKHGGKAPISAADQDAFARFAYAAALHFKNKNVVGFEIWNEPNIPQFWPSPDPTKYATLLNKASAAIKSADPAAKTISGGTSGIDMVYSLQLANQINFKNLDAIGVHPYTRDNPELYAAGYVPLNKINSLKAKSPPVWNTESGYPSYGYFDPAVYGDGLSVTARNRQAILNLRTLFTQMIMNTPLITFTSLTDYGENATDKEANFGLMTNLGWDKPSMHAMRMLMASQWGRTFKGAMGNLPPGLHAVKWESKTDSVFAVWSDDAMAGSYVIKIPSSVRRIKRWNGAGVVGIRNGEYTEATLSEQDGPIFIHLTK